jgi:hypothetical protein
MGKKHNLINHCLYSEMWNFAHTTLVTQGMIKREISDVFKNYSLKLPFLSRLVLGCSKVGIQVISFENKNVAVATLSRMEKPEGSSYFCDLASFIRPSADLRAPILHTDALDPMAGVQGMFEVHLYNYNPADINIEDFLGDNLGKINEALKILAPYQKIPEKKLTKYTAYLEPYLNKYRVDIMQPDAGDVVALKKFYQDELAAFKLYLEAYLSSLSRLTPEKSIVENNKNGFDKLIEEIVEKDFAIKMVKKIFEDDFQKYFHEGCWRTGYYGDNV